jgi:uncharacterized membrane protein
MQTMLRHSNTILHPRHVPFLRPLTWLARGVSDLIHHPKATLAHGVIISGLFLLTLLMTSVHVYVLATVISGFMLLGPVLAAGLCEIARRRQQGGHVSFDNSLEGLSRHSSALMRFAGMLAGFSLFWFFLSGLILRLTIGEVAPALDQSLWGDFALLVSAQEVMLYLLVGGLLAALVFVLSVVSVPAIIDNDIRAFEAMQLSLQVVADNPFTMLLWAALIVALVAVSIASFLLGMIVIYPLLGLAGWHAYRDLVSADN